MMPSLPLWTLKGLIWYCRLWMSHTCQVSIKILILYSEDECRSCRCGMTWRWEINHRTLIFGGTNPLSLNFLAIYFLIFSPHYFWGSEAAVFSIMQIMAMAAARAHSRETRATFIKFSTHQTLHVSMHPALKAAPGLLGPQTWLSNASEEA